VSVGIDYKAAGVDMAGEGKALSRLLAWLEPTEAFSACKVVLGPSDRHYAAVMDAGLGMGLALSTDGVGTKLLIAEKLRRYDTVGIDCIAMNANDVVCVGARPIAFLDYLAVQRVDAEFLDQLGKGLNEGARQAGVAIPGGEIAQLPEMITGDGTGFELAGMCVGIVALDRIVRGEALAPDDVVIGLASSGLHSNGYTLARKALEGLSYTEVAPGMDRPLGDVLLEPTRMYVKSVLALLEKVPAHGLAHITGDGLLNLLRLNAGVGFNIDAMPEPLPIFELIRDRGKVTWEAMFETFNMGIGFCVMVGPEDVPLAVEALTTAGENPVVIGSVTDEAGIVRVPAYKIVGQDGVFRASQA